MPELSRIVQVQRLYPVIQRWIKLFGREEPFRVSELWSGAGHAATLREQVPDEAATARCREFVRSGMLEELDDGRFRLTGAFTRENVEASLRQGATAPTEAFSLAGKERDQKFNQILSLRQGQQDFAKVIEPCRAARLPVAVVYLDIDHFKRLNTAYTEVVVDATVLPDFMRLLVAQCEYRALPCRHGGDEFVLVLPNCTADEAWAFTERLRQRIEGHPFRVHEVNEQLTISAGLAIWPDDGADFHQVLAVANARKAQAKEIRNTVVRK